jgi:hypothetical protein
LEEEMKKVILIMAVAAVFAFTGTVMASPPVCPPFEGFLIETETDIEVYGLASDTEEFEWHWNNDWCEGNLNGIAPGAGGALAPGESEARITYSEEFDSFNGYAQTIPATTYHKKFTADSQEDPNLVVEKDIGFTSDGEAGSHANLVEIASEEVVSAGGVGQGGTLFTGVLALCPWAPTPNDEPWPATNEGIAMGSMFDIDYIIPNGDVGEIDFSSDTVVSVTEGVYMNYVVDAVGKGKIQAEMIARLWEGSEVMNPNTPADTILNSVATYEQTSMADGIFDFHKGMSYRAIFDEPTVTPIGLEILTP